VAYKLVTRIKRKGWPTTSKKWRKAHNEANKHERKRFGKRAFKAVQKIVERMPPDELLGTHTKTGKIRISSRVPKKYRPQIAAHERFEHRLMRGKKKRIKRRK
jgi:hypothetical protein